MRRLIAVLAAVLVLVLAWRWNEGRERALPDGVLAVLRGLAPGAPVGSSVGEVRARAPKLVRVGSMGYAAAIDAAPFQAIHVFTPRREQASDGEERDTPVFAIELATSRIAAAHQLLGMLASRLGTAPGEGCVRVGPQLQEVRWWPLRRGGIAVLSDYRDRGVGLSSSTPIARVLAFSGAFRGSRTLRASYSEQGCGDRSLRWSDGDDAAIRASDSLVLSFAESAASRRQVQHAATMDSIQKIIALEVPACPAPGLDTTPWRLHEVLEPPVSFRLPALFTQIGPDSDKTTEARYLNPVAEPLEGGAAQGWSEPVSSGFVVIRGTQPFDLRAIPRYELRSECDEVVNGVRMHVQLAKTKIAADGPWIVAATYSLSTGGYLIAEGRAEDGRRASELLQAVRTMRINFPWWRPPAR